jgi:hypothetical protein
MQVEITSREIVIDAGVLAPLLDVAAAGVPEVMHRQAITSICERGIDAHEGQYRLSFWDLPGRLLIS